MSEKKFALQKLSDGYLQVEAAIVRDIICAVNDWNRWNPAYTGDVYSYCAMSADDVAHAEQDELIDLVPVGSVEFCSFFAQKQGFAPLPALNVPPALRGYKWTGRIVGEVPDMDTLGKALTVYEKENPSYLTLIKPADIAKRFDLIGVNSGFYKQALEEKPGPYFISEELKPKILAEWRIFFRRGRIVAAKPYILDEWVCPDQTFVEDALHTWADAPTAGTLDVAVLADGNTVVIEAHPLIACGLYGFDDPELLDMLCDAWKWHISSH